MDPSWIECRRSDGERLGWIRMVGEDFVAINALGREISGRVDWLEAEERLERLGLGYLADPWVLSHADGRQTRVRITEVSSEGVRVVEDALGSASVVGSRAAVHQLPFPAPEALQPADRTAGSQ
nr:hypothetical protein [Zhihengliuella flava]